MHSLYKEDTLSEEALEIKKVRDCHPAPFLSGAGTSGQAPRRARKERGAVCSVTEEKPWTRVVWDGLRCAVGSFPAWWFAHRAHSRQNLFRQMEAQVEVWSLFLLLLEILYERREKEPQPQTL